MAAVSMKTVAEAITANAAAVGTAASLTTDNCTALGAFLQVIADKGGYFEPIQKFLSDTNKAQISSRQ